MYDFENFTLVLSLSVDNTRLILSSTYSSSQSQDSNGKNEVYFTWMQRGLNYAYKVKV